MKKRCFLLMEGFHSLWKSKMLMVTRTTLIVLLLLASQSFASGSDSNASANNLSEQQSSVTGTITDDSGEPLPGVTVVVLGTTNGTITNFDGIYTIGNVPENATLQFTFVGMEPQEIAVAGKQQINVVMASSTIGLDEVIAVGYGTQTKRAVTGAIQSVSGDELGDMPVSSAAQTLQGKLAGVQINQTSGRPGEGMMIRIRGAGSISGGSDPLYVVDGFPIDGDMSDINVEEIESISVLKDASSTSLYGSRAANGVVLITTKTAKSGTTEVNFNSNYGFQVMPEAGRPDMMNGTEFAQFKKESYEDRGQEVPLAFQNPSQYGEGTDWYDIMFQNAPMQDYSVSLTSRTDKFSASSIAGYTKQDGIMINSGYERFSLRVNTAYNVNDNITIGFNVAPTYSKRHSAGGDGAFYQGNLLYLGILNWPIIDKDGNIGDTGYTINDKGALGGFPQANYYESAQQVKNTSSSTNILTNGYIEIEPIEGLKLKQSANVQYTSGTSKLFNPSTVSTSFARQPPVTSFAEYGSTESINWLSETSASYTKSWNETHNLSAIAVYSAQEYSAKGLGISVENFPDDRISDVDAAVTIVKGNENEDTFGEINEWSLLSYLARVNYDYKGKYLASFSIRRDGSSRFGKDNLWGNFPSASLGWIASDEDFFPQDKALNYLKFRGSYGITGNNRIGNYTQYASVNLGNNYIFGSSVASGSSVGNLANRTLSWEKSNQFNVGFDLGLFDNRISLNYDYYIKNTNEMLYNFSIPQSSGFSSFQGNSGELKFWGHEIALTSRNFVGDFEWTTNLNITLSDNEVISLADNVDAIYGGGHITKVGQRVGLFWGLVADGIYETTAEYDASAKASGSAVGTIKFKDMGGPNGAGPDGQILNSDVGGDRVVIGDPTPSFLFGMTNNFRYKDFDLSVVLSGSVGNDIANRFHQGAINLDGPFNVLTEIKDRWRSEENPGAGKYGTTAYQTGMQRDWFSSNFIEDGSFLTVKNVTLGYNVNVSDISFISRCRIYGSVQQLYTFTKYSGNNPEVSNNQSVLQLGDDQAGYPVPRTWTFGVNIGF